MEKGGEPRVHKQLSSLHILLKAAVVHWHVSERQEDGEMLLNLTHWIFFALAVCFGKCFFPFIVYTQMNNY